MVKLLKITLLVISIFLMLIIGAVILLPLIIDPNDYKPEIEAAAYRYTEKKLALEGSLEFTVFPWLGITTGKFLILNPSTPDQQALATIDEGHLKIKLLPLLRKKVELSRIVLKNPVIYLITDKEGINNWSKAPAKIVTVEKQLPDTGTPENSITVTDDTQEPSSKSPFPQEMMIAGVSIENGRIIRINEQKNRQTEITHFNCEIGALAYNQPVPIDISMELHRKLSQSEQLTAKGLVVFNKNLDHFKVTDFEINALIKKASIDNTIVVTAGSPNIELDWQKQGLTIAKLNITSGNMALSTNLVGNKIKDNPEIQGIVTLSAFNLREFLTYLGKSVPTTKDDSSFTRLSGSFNLLASKNSAQFNEFQAQLDDSNIAGNFHVTDFKQPAFKFNLNIDTINLDRYSPIKPALKKETQAPTQEQTKAPEKSATESKTKTSKNHLPEPAPQANKQKKSDPAIFPVDLLRKINAIGTFSISKMITKGLTLQNLTIKLNAKNGVLKTSHKINKLYQGHYSGNFHLNVNKQPPTIALNEKFARIQAAPLLKALYGKARLSGTLTGNTRLSSFGNTTQALKTKLKGKAHVSLKKGVIYGFNLEEIVNKGKALLKKKDYTPQKKHTDYSIITASATIKNGLVKNEDLYAESKRLRVSGKGAINLTNKQLDYDVLAKLMERKQSADEMDHVKRSLGINIAGSTKQPTYTLDLKSLISEKEKQKLYDKAEKKLGKGISDLLKQLLH
jgi:AsmA protein